MQRPRPTRILRPAFSCDSPPVRRHAAARTGLAPRPQHSEACERPDPETPRRWHPRHPIAALHSPAAAFRSERPDLRSGLIAPDTLQYSAPPHTDKFHSSQHPAAKPLNRPGTPQHPEPAHRFQHNTSRHGRSIPQRVTCPGNSAANREGNLSETPQLPVDIHRHRILSRNEQPARPFRPPPARISAAKPAAHRAGPPFRPPPDSPEMTAGKQQRGSDRPEATARPAVRIHERGGHRTVPSPSIHSRPQPTHRRLRRSTAAQRSGTKRTAAPPSAARGSVSRSPRPTIDTRRIRRFGSAAGSGSSSHISAL